MEKRIRAKMQKKIVKYRKWGIAVLTAITINSTPTILLAEFLPNANRPSEFQLRNYMDTPLIEFPISYGFGSMNEIDRGVGYISCVPNRVDVFNFNLVITSNVAKYFADQSPIFIGIRKQSGDGESNVVGVPPSAELDRPPEVFGFSDFVESSPYLVREFDPIGVANYEDLYLRSRISAQFFQNLKSNQEIVMIVNHSDGSGFMFAFSIRYNFGNETANRFLTACLQ